VPEREPLNVLCLHETATTGRIWDPLTAALSGYASVIAPDRPGWGEAEAPEGYSRTTVAEQAGHATQALGDRGPAVVCGAGIGAVVALELALAEPELVIGTVLVEPPLLSFLPEATDRLAADVAAVREAVSESGREAALDAYLAGRLPALGAGAGRIPPGQGDRGPGAAAALFAELSAVPAWERSDAELAAATKPSLIAIAADSPPLLAKSAIELARVLARSDLRETEPGLPHFDRAGELAALVVEVADTLA
jgi:pimeloyl-ACP methyl ester carboxylesterase